MDGRWRQLSAVALSLAGVFTIALPHTAWSDSHAEMAMTRVVGMDGEDVILGAGHLAGIAVASAPLRNRACTLS